MSVAAFRTFALSLALPVVASCGPAESPPPVAPISKPTATATAKTNVVEDRTPVDAPPPGVVVQMHSVGPRALVRALKSYLPASAPSLDPRALLRELGDGFAERIVDVDKPLDLAVQIPEHEGKGDPPIPKAAVAAGVEDDVDVAAALKATTRVEPLPGGVLRLTPLSGGQSRCVVAPAIGPAKRRLVCALDPVGAPDPMALAPWLARGVTRQPEPTSTLRLDVDVATIKKRYANEIVKGRAQIQALVGPEVKIGYPEIDRVLKQIAKNVVEETFDLLEDLEAIGVEVSAPAEGVALGLTLGFGGTKSWSAKALLAGGDQPAPPPATFGKLPSENVWLAQFSRATAQSDALAAPIQTALRDLVDAATSELKWPKADRDAALDVVKTMFMPAADVASVTSFLGHVTVEKDAPQPPGSDAKSLVHFFGNKSLTVSVSERDAKAPSAFLKSFANLVTRPSFAQAFHKLTREKLSLKVAAKPFAPKDAPKGSVGQRFEVDVATRSDDDVGGAKAKGKPKEIGLGKFVAEALVVPSGPTRTWLGWGQNLGEGDLWKRLSIAMSGAGATLSGRPGYDFVVKNNPTSGTMFMIDGFARSVDRKGKAEKMLAQLPDGGQGALVFQSTPQKPPKSVAEMHLLVPRDLVSFFGLFFGVK